MGDKEPVPLSTHNLKKVRYLFLKGYEKLTDKQKIKLNEILEEHSDLACSYYLKEK